MTLPYIGDVRMFGGNFAPVGWATTDGQLMPISQNTALFSLLGTTYGGNGTSNFALPDLRGRAPMHAGSGAGLSPRVLGENGGAAATDPQNVQTTSLIGGSGSAVNIGPVGTQMPYQTVTFILSLFGTFPTQV